MEHSIFFGCSLCFYLSDYQRCNVVIVNWENYFLVQLIAFIQSIKRYDFCQLSICT